MVRNSEPTSNQIFQDNGLLSRNMMDAMAFCPPLIIDQAQISVMLDIVERSLEILSSDLAV